MGPVDHLCYLLAPKDPSPIRLRPNAAVVLVATLTTGVIGCARLRLGLMGQRDHLYYLQVPKDPSPIWLRPNAAVVFVCTQKNQLTPLLAGHLSFTYLLISLNFPGVIPENCLNRLIKLDTLS